jgi:hypothetical protein
MEPHFVEVFGPRTDVDLPYLQSTSTMVGVIVFCRPAANDDDQS